MELINFEIRRPWTVEAEMRGDFLNSGEDGYTVSIVGFGPTEEKARENLAKAIKVLDEFKKKTGAEAPA